MNKQDQQFIHWLTAAIAIVFVMGLAVAVLAAEVANRQAGCVALNATPQAIGDASSRNDYYVHVWADSTDGVVCGYNDEATLSLTPGPNSGDMLEPGEGKHICVYADQIFRCRSRGSSIVCFDQGRMVTPTPTP